VWPFLFREEARASHHVSVAFFVDEKEDIRYNISQNVTKEFYL